MASLAKTLMDIYADEQRSWLNASSEEPHSYEIASAYGDAESMVNNLMHGVFPSEWVPRFVRIMRERAGSSEPPVREHFELIASIAEETLSSS